MLSIYYFIEIHWLFSLPVVLIACNLYSNMLNVVLMMSLLNFHIVM